MGASAGGYKGSICQNEEMVEVPFDLSTRVSIQVTLAFLAPTGVMENNIVRDFYIVY
jgi:hypothetical protein